MPRTRQKARRMPRNRRTERFERTWTAAEVNRPSFGLYPCQCQLDIKPLSLNQWQNWHWAKRARFKETLARFLDVAFSPSTKNALRADFGKKKVTITCFSTRVFDADNLWGGTAKPILDALCRLGYIAGDDPDHVETFVSQEKVKGRHRCCVRVRLEKAG